jgi:hypothetical protein
LNPAPAGSLLEHLQQIPDPRGRQGLRHVFTAMLATVVCASWQGARGYLAFAQWIHAQDVALWHELGFERKPPKLGAFRKLLMAIPPEQFEAAVRNWVQQCVGEPRLSGLTLTQLNNGPIQGISCVPPAARYSKSVVAGPKTGIWPSNSALADEGTAEP